MADYHRGEEPFHTGYLALKEALDRLANALQTEISDTHKFQKLSVQNKITSIDHLIMAYLRCQEDENALSPSPKDRLTLSEDGERVIRKKGIHCATHGFEYQLGDHMHKLLTEIGGLRKGVVGAEGYHSIVEAFGQLAKAMDDAGIYLDQTKNYANACTMPKKTRRKGMDEALVPSEPLDHHSLFPRLHLPPFKGR